VPLTCRLEPYASPRDGADDLGADRSHPRRALQGEPRAVEHQGGHADLGGTAASEPQRQDQAARGVGAEHDVEAAGLLADEVDRGVELGVVERQVRHVVRGVARAARAAALAQVQRVERVAPGREELGQLGLEEVVAEAVHPQECAPWLRGRRARAGACPDERRDDLTLAVGIGPEIDRPLLVAGSQHVLDPR